MKRKILYALLSLAIAIGLWVYVVSVVSPESTETFHNIPVVIDGESLLRERGLMITTEKIPQVTLKLYGNRSDLRKLNSSNITIIMDVSRISDPGEKELHYSVSYPGDVPGGSIQIMSQSPERISITVAEKDRKTVPVKLEYIGKVDDQYIVSKTNLELNHESITVEGPADVIEKLDHAKISIDLEGKTQTINQVFGFTLCDAAGEPVDSRWLTANVSEVNVKLPIQMVKEVKLELDVIYGGGATEQNTTVTISPSSIQISGSEQVIADLNALKLGTINLGEMNEGDTKTFDLDALLQSLGVTNLTSNSEASVTVSFTGLETKELKVTNIVAQNVPEGLVAKLYAQDITVKVRGPKEKIQTIKAENITVYVDFAGETAGSEAALEAMIVFSDDFSDVGAVGKYECTGKLTQK